MSQKKVIVVDCGHGGIDPGMIGIDGLRKNEVEETHNSGSQKDPKERSKVGKNGGESE